MTIDTSKLVLPFSDPAEPCLEFDMTFISICVALYDYRPQGDNELAIQEGELIYILEKSTEDDWWKAKKRAPGEEEEEPVGLIPNNYVQEVDSPPRKTNYQAINITFAPKTTGLHLRSIFHEHTE